MEAVGGRDALSVLREVDARVEQQLALLDEIEIEIEDSAVLAAEVYGTSGFLDGDGDDDDQSDGNTARPMVASPPSAPPAANAAVTQPASTGMGFATFAEEPEQPLGTSAPFRSSGAASGPVR